jgi:hypothetical protein
MVNLFNKIPGFVVTPPGMERKVLALLPKALLVGSLLLGIPSLIARWLLLIAPHLAATTLVSTVDIYGISLLFLHWAVILTVAIAAFIVLVMKGPAYVADPYPLIETDTPDDPASARRR